MDYTVHEILQARILEWVAFPFSRGSSQPRDRTEVSRIENINMEIAAKEITAFIGPSGCGKSTLLKTLNRMNDLVDGCRIEGKVLLEGEDIYSCEDVNLLRKREPGQGWFHSISITI